MKLKSVALRFSEHLNHIYDENEAEALFYIALQHVMNLNRSAYLLKKDTAIDHSIFNRFDLILDRLAKQEPIQYILEETYFYGLYFKVDPSVLIPRPETEELVDWILSVCNTDQKLTKGNLNILDLGTGSGCIAIALKKNKPDFHVMAIDIAEDSLTTAEINAELNQVEIDFIQDDILNPTVIKKLQFDVIVSNPPYITYREKEDMHTNVVAHEPHRALFVSNEKPLVFYEAIADFAMENLKEGGYLFFEINEFLGEETIQLLKHKMFINIELKKDIQGKDRMIKCNKAY
ncbi:peptide chain release factor N(5)-glutamine methyltransferase [Pedobacter sp.]|uniref:peptide chain release factor N(5)-glutamine methyltransferase n=1 Tax=Pedobacter sp. TaxID=1411316 RepID=UPI00396C3A36